MAEFKKSEWWEDEFIKAPLDVKKNLLSMLETAKQVIKIGPDIEKALNHSKTIGELTKQTDKLVKAETDMTTVQKQLVIVTDQYAKSNKKLSLEEIELAKVTKATEVAVAKQSKAVIEQKKVLDSVNKTTKEKTALGEKDAKTINATNASIKELSAALAKNRSDYDALTSAEKRNSKEGKELLATIQAQDSELKGLKKQMGQNQLEVGNYEGAMKGLKDELKASKDELAGIAATLGMSSPEYIAAAKRAGELKDEFNDINESIKDLSGGSGFERAGDQSKRFIQQFKAGDLKGATGTLKGLASTIQGLTFKESIAGAGGFTKALGAIGKAILTNPLFLLAAAIVGIGVAINALKDKVPFLTKVFDAVGTAIDFVVEKGKEFSDWALGSSFIADEKAQAIADAAQKEVDAIRERYDDEIAIAEAAGKDVADLERKKQEAILKEAEKGIVALSKIQNQSEEQKEQYQAFLTIVKNANRDIQVEEGKHQVELQKARDAAAKERLAKENAAWEERKKRLAEEAAAFKLGLADQRKLAERDFGKIGEGIDKGIKARTEALLKAIVPVTKTVLTTVRDRWEDTLTKIGDAFAQWSQAIGGLFRALTAGRIADIDKQQKASELASNKRVKEEKDRLAAQLEDETLTAEERDQLKVRSDARVRAIEEQQEKRQIDFEARRRAAIRRQAIFEKAIALTQAVIDGAAAVVAQLKVVGAGIGLAIAAGAMAALKVATIAATPIPAAEKGMASHKGGLIIAGEKGRERIKVPGRKPFLSADKATLYDLPAGTSIDTHEKTMQQLASIQGITERLDREFETNRKIEKKLDAINNTIKNKREHVIKGQVTGYREGGTRAKYIESHRNRS